MDAKAWKEAVCEIVDDYYEGREERINLLSELLEEVDAAKQILRDKGYAVTGQPLLDVVNSLKDQQ